MGRLEVNHGACEGAGSADDTGESPPGRERRRASNPDFKVWNIHLSQGAAIATGLKVDSQPCDVALGKLKSMSKAQNVRIREFSVSGRPAWEEKEHLRGDTMLFER